MREAERYLRPNGLPYTTIWGPGHGLEWGHAIRFWERLRRGHREVTADQAVVVADAMSLEPEVRRKLENVPAGETVTLARHFPGVRADPWFKALTKIRPNDVQYLRNLLSRNKPQVLTDPPRIRLSTIHSAKGSEADHVVLNTDLSKRCKELIWNAPGTEERVFYVGVTRTKQTLTLCGYGNPLFTGE